jgi:hypothetical protein
MAGLESRARLLYLPALVRGRISLTLGDDTLTRAALHWYPHESSELSTAHVICARSTSSVVCAPLSYLTTSDLKLQLIKRTRTG